MIGRSRIRKLGEKWHETSYYLSKYDMKPSELLRARQNGLPFEVIRNTYFYNEDDFHAYYAGLIGFDVEDGKSKERGNEINE